MIHIFSPTIYIYIFRKSLRPAGILIVHMFRKRSLQVVTKDHSKHFKSRLVCIINRGDKSEITNRMSLEKNLDKAHRAKVFNLHDVNETANYL